jgi:hypothetical protein
MKHSNADHTDNWLHQDAASVVTKNQQQIAVKPRPQLLILMLIPGFNMHHKYRGPGIKSRIDIALRYGIKVNLNQ